MSTSTVQDGWSLTTSDFRPVLIVPIYNHGKAFADMLPALVRHGLPVIVVDDGSDRETRGLLESLAARFHQLQIVCHQTNQGKGSAVTTGLKSAEIHGYTHALQIDADGQHDTGDIQQFLEEAQTHPDAVIVGTPRFDNSMPLGRRIGRHLTHLWIWIETLSLTISDSMCGFRVYPIRAVRPLLDARFLGKRMDFDPEILVRLYWQGTPIRELPTQVIYPADGHSNFKLFTDNVLISSMHVRLVIGMLLRLPILLRNRWRRPHAGRPD